MNPLIVKPSIRCMYSCEECGVEKAVIIVPERSAIQDVNDWMEYTLSPVLVDDHERRSPRCKPKAITKIFIPLDTDAGIGQKGYS